MGMELRDLEYLLACVDAGSFTRASREVHVAQPTLSHAMKRLEDELGRPLLHRPRARDGIVVPTDAGHVVVACARQILASVSTLHESLAALDGVARGTVRLGAAPSLAMSFVPALLGRVRETAPEIVVHVETGSTDALVERVRARSLDLAVVADIPPRARTGLVTKALFEERFVAVAGRALPLGRTTTLARLATGPLLLPGADVFHGQRVREAFARAGVRTLDPVATLGSAEALVAAARGGLGYALLPERCVDARDTRLRVATIRGERLVRTVHVVTHHEAAVRAAVVALRDAIDHEADRGDVRTAARR
jgi:DNA-binding transcriptional LysR family regulator